jgi:hypothetical protein
MAPLAAKPAQKGALEQFAVEPIGLCPSVLARDRNAGRMDHLRLDVARSQPTSQPEPVAASLEGKDDALNRVPSLARLVAPALEKPQQRGGIGWEFLERMPFDTGDDPRHEPARLAHVDDRDQCAVLRQRDKRPVQAVQFSHGGAPLVVRRSECAASRHSPHSFCTNQTDCRARPRRFSAMRHGGG